MKLVASAQKMGLKAAWLDPEFSFVPSWAAQHGVDISKLVIGDDFNNGEHCLEYMLAMCRTKFADIVVLDSVAALVPRAELEHTLDQVTIGATGRMMSLAVKQIVQASADHRVTTIFINQTRDKVGVMFGNPETTPGGKALKFYCSMRIRAERYKVEQQEIDGKKTPIRALSKVRFVKNKVAIPFLDGEFEIRFDNLSVNPLLTLLRRAVEYRVIRKQKIDDIQQFVWWVGSTGKEAIPTNCSDMSELVDWVSVSEPDAPKKIAEMVIAKAVEKQEENTIDAVIKAYANGEQVTSPDVPKGNVVEEKV
jgi:recombination protein RecA